MCGISIRPREFANTRSKINYRGPDSTVKLEVDEYLFTFHRLAIMDPDARANQPFTDDKLVVVCNGEIFNFKALRENNQDYPYKSFSDCEVLMPLLQRHSIYEVCHLLDGEFAFVAYDKVNQTIIAARDPMGIRPLFYGKCTNGKLAFASEMKELLDCCAEIYPFLPGYFYDGIEFKPYLELGKIDQIKHTDLNQVTTQIHNLLIDAVDKRLHADVPLGFLLSGGLDSSLVCAIANRALNKPLDTFAIGLDVNPIDLKYAKQMADFLGSNHHEVIFTDQDIIDNLKQVIWVIESWDVTTIRASIPMYLLCKYVRNNTHIQVLLTGEVSDELFGYKYTDFAPDATEFQKESQKRITELYMYDVLRADRSISSNSLEARVPFADKAFVKYVMEIDPKLKLNTYGMGKYLLRKAFEGKGYLPEEILWREKAAFSDAVGHGLVDTLANLANQKYTDQEFAQKVKAYKTNPPLTKEALMYREIFAKLFPNQDHVICSYWLPNSSWPNCDLIDPSARYLPNYGQSGE